MVKLFNSFGKVSILILFVIIMKVLLVTIAIGSKYLDMYKKKFYESQRKYAEKCGYDFKVITNFLDKTIQQRSTISFNKVLVCSQGWSNQYDFIIFVDADIFININSPAIHSYVDYENYIGIVDEYSQPTKERRLKIQKKNGWEENATEYYRLSGFDIETDMVFNSGVLVMQPKIHRDFLQNIYDKYVRQSISHPRGFHFEQSCIGYEIQKEKIYKVIDNKFNALCALISQDNAENINIEIYTTQNYFIHYAGLIKIP